MRGGIRSLVSVVLVCALAAIPASAQSAGGVSAAAWNDTTLSTGFGQGGVVRLAGWTKILDTTELPDRRLLVRVQHTTSGGAVDADGLVRLLADGSLDPSFGSTGPTPGSIVIPAGTGTRMFVRASGKVLLGDGVVRQYTTAGELDTSFGSGGTVNMVAGPAFELDDGSVIVTILNIVSAGGLGLLHLDANGAAVPAGLTFTNLTVSGPVPVRLASGDWRLISGGRSSSDLSERFSRVIGLTASGAVDTGFGGGDGVVVLTFDASAYSAVVGVSLMTDQRLVVGLVAGGSYALTRLSLNGDVDTSFGAGGVEAGPWRTYGGTLTSLAVDSDGSLTLGITGRLDHAPLTYNSTVLRTLPHGDVDQTFQPHGWTPGSVWLSELGVSGLSVGGSVTALSGGAVLVSTTHYDPDFNAPAVAQLTRLQLPPHGSVGTIPLPAGALTPAVRLGNARHI